MKARGTRLIANGAQVDALNGHRQREQEVEDTMRVEREKLRLSKLAAENQRVAQARAEQHERVNGSRRVEVMTANGRSHTVQKIKTTAQRLMEDGHLPRDLKYALDEFAMVVARATGAAVDEGDDSTNRMTASYGDGGGGEFGSKTPSDKVLDARRILREIGTLIPPELRDLFIQLVAEEVGSLVGAPLTLEQIGERRGFDGIEAHSAGAAQVYDVIAMLAHFAKTHGVIGKSKINGSKVKIDEISKSQVARPELSVRS